MVLERIEINVVVAVVSGRLEKGPGHLVVLQILDEFLEFVIVGGAEGVSLHPRIAAQLLGQLRLQTSGSRRKERGWRYFFY